MKNKRAELKMAYKLTPKQAGVFQVRNKVNGKVLLGSSLNLHGPLNRHKFDLDLGSHQNVLLQKEYREFGPDSFSFEILEVLKEKQDPEYDVSAELKKLEQRWWEKLQPTGIKGYNKDAKIRQL